MKRVVIKEDQHDLKFDPGPESLVTSPLSTVYLIQKWIDTLMSSFRLYIFQSSHLFVLLCGIPFIEPVL